MLSAIRGILRTYAIRPNSYKALRELRKEMDVTVMQWGKIPDCKRTNDALDAYQKACQLDLQIEPFQYMLDCTQKTLKTANHNVKQIDQALLEFLTSGIPILNQEVTKPASRPFWITLLGAACFALDCIIGGIMDSRKNTPREGLFQR